MKFECAYDELVDVAILQPNPRNPNKHPQRQIELLAKIINFAGQRSPIIVSKRSGFLVAGHGRLEALKLLGWEKAAVDYQEYENEAAEYQHMISDNKIAELAETDSFILSELVEEFGQTLDIDLFGINNLIVEHEQSDFAPTDSNESEEVHKICPHCGETL